MQTDSRFVASKSFYTLTKTDMKLILIDFIIPRFSSGPMGLSVYVSDFSMKDVFPKLYLVILSEFILSDFKLISCS